MQQDNSTKIEAKELMFANEQLLPEIIKMLDEGHTVTLRLRGFSMRPFLEDNRDKAMITKARNIKRGDAVLAEDTYHHYVLHRIISIKGDNVILRGDGNINVERCKRDDVKGFVIGFYRKGRKQMDKTNGLKWCIYSFLWCTLFPMRRYLLAFYRKIWIPIFGTV